MKQCCYVSLRARVVQERGNCRGRQEGWEESLAAGTSLIVDSR